MRWFSHWHLISTASCKYRHSTWNVTQRCSGWWVKARYLTCPKASPSRCPPHTHRPTSNTPRECSKTSQQFSSLPSYNCPSTLSVMTCRLRGWSVTIVNNTPWVLVHAKSFSVTLFTSCSPKLKWWNPRTLVSGAIILCCGRMTTGLRSDADAKSELVIRALILTCVLERIFTSATWTFL